MNTTRTGSARVAADLRERIRDGSLGPGDRVPSTREIVRDWGVAMATATKALTTLRSEGWVRPVPGVGTVVIGVASGWSAASPAVRPPAPAPTTAGAPASAASGTGPHTPSRTPRATSGGTATGDLPGLSTGRVVAAGIAVADDEGLAALSMRRVSAELGVAPMSLYRHVRDKDDLLTHMVNAVFEEWTPSAAGVPVGWRERIEQVCAALWERFRRHPWLASALSLTRPQAVVGGMVYTDQILSGLLDLGLSAKDAFDHHLILLNFVRGLAVNLEAEQQAEAETGRTADEWVDEHHGDTQALLDAHPMPTLRSVIETLSDGYDVDLDLMFTTGLRHLLDGFGGASRGGDPAPAGVSARSDGSR